MKIRWLIIDNRARAEIQRVITYAQAHPLSIHDVFGMLRHPPGKDPDRGCVIPIGYSCVFTIEQQPGGLARHLAVAVLGPGRAPNENAVELLMHEFGFQRPAQPRAALARGRRGNLERTNWPRQDRRQHRRIL